MIRVLGQHFGTSKDLEDLDETDLENVQTCTVSPQKMERWQADLEDLIQEYDHHIWLSCCMLLKLVPQLVPL